VDTFVKEKLGLRRSKVTTQIEHYDHLAALFDALKRINTILIDLSRDMWMYISSDYFKLTVVTTEVGSSTMPHKVNPIDFENAEGNLGVGSALLEHFSAKLPISRLQRDLSDSTVLRNIGVPFGHLLISLSSLQNGLKKIHPNLKALEDDLNANWAVVSEGLQTVLRREGYPEPYEALKALTRTGCAISAQTITEWIKQLNVSDTIKAELAQITPFNYVGVASEIVSSVLP